LWARERAQKTRSVTLREFGERVKNPVASVVVPIYGRSDFIRYQLALFANDDEFRSGAVELIYFIDDPTLVEGVVQLCLGWALLYVVPFVLAYTGHNHGFSGANNLGVSIARGDAVVLLNSDAMPKRPGWVGRMVRAYASLPGCGLLGLKLLYYDESLQHDGMTFEKFPFWNDLYGNNHPGKGLPNRSELDAPPREAEAVTGACLAISRALYLELGGLCEEFVFGDFEDSELCMRVRHAGKRVFYLPGEELYHLERQSQSMLPGGDTWRWQLTVFNAWLQDRKWRKSIDELKGSPIAVRKPRSVGPRGGV
jgi:O-antigen biosynthesis protein